MFKEILLVLAVITLAVALSDRKTETGHERAHPRPQHDEESLNTAESANPGYGGGFYKYGGFGGYPGFGGGYPIYGGGYPIYGGYYGGGYPGFGYGGFGGGFKKHWG